MLDKVLIRAADISLALIALVVLGFPMLLVAGLIRLEDRGPALFVQQRVGRNGRLFRIYKFRSMRVAPPSSATTSLTKAEMIAARAKFQTTKENDPRITRIGRILRPSHIDELPQLLNVLFGDMSMVGARPDTPVQEVDYTPEYWLRRHRLRPGITGPAQLQSNTATLMQRSALEETWTQAPRFTVYIEILVKTAFKILKRTGN